MAVLITAGCSTSSPSQHYFLASIAEQDGAAPEPDPKAGTLVVDVQVRLAHYLDRPQIVTRIGPNQLRLDEFNRWTGSFKHNINDVLVQNLSALLRNAIVVRRPFPSSLPIDYQVFIDITQFDSTPGQSVTLRATWGILAKGDKTNQSLRPKNFNLTVPDESRDYKILVAAQSRILADLSREIAQTLGSPKQREP